MKKIAGSVLIALFLLFQSVDVSCFELETHRQVSERAVLSSHLDDFLKTELNFAGGIADSLAGKRIIDLITEGSVLEDTELRFFNHFHNPLRNWKEAGLKGILFNEKSSILWGQEESVFQQFAWQDARQSYFRGLTAETQAEREEHLALTFRVVGQGVHLVQDAAVPAHTRNDPHPPGNADGFEKLVQNLPSEDSNLFAQLISASTSFDPSILLLPPNPLAPIPIARIIDTTDPDQAAAVPSAGTDQGLAEYSNSNFLSEDTIFRGFTFPRVESLGASFDENEPGTGKPRSYFPKIAGGEIINHFVAEGTLSESLISLLAGDKGYILDRQVLRDYAEKLLPRAIGYSAGLIDYFFRGRMDVVLSEDQPASDPITDVFVKVRNVTPGEDAGAGQVVAVASSDDGFLAVSLALTVTLTRVDQQLVFDFSESPIPADASGLFVTVVYKGPLGLEEEAVTAGGTPLSVLTLSPENPVLSCSDTSPSINFSVTGGVPPYTWSSTKGTITPSGAENEIAILAPAEDTKGPTEVAFLRYGHKLFIPESGCSIVAAGSVRQNCAGQVLSFLGSSCQQITPSLSDPHGDCKASFLLGGVPDCGPAVCGTDSRCGVPECNPNPVPEEICSALLADPGLGAILFLGGCGCQDMEGSSVTVTDASGASVSTTVSLQ